MSDSMQPTIQAFTSIITNVADSDEVMVIDELVSLFEGLEFMLDFTSEDAFKAAITEALNHPISLENAGAVFADDDIADRIQIIEVALSLSLTHEEYSFQDHQTLHDAIAVLFTPEEAPLVTRLLEIGLERAVIEASLGLYDDDLFFEDEDD